MAQEAILNVSLKDYKKNIDELRGSLLGLEQDSEEYKKIAEELKDKQDKLNEVMSVGKEAVNAVDGSYNQLSATLSQLKKEWKNMKIGSAEWQDMATRINDINDQLKGADAQVGVFTRNVGDYANAFEEAFKKATDGLATMPGVIGNIAGTTKQLIPLIQKTTATATKGLAGVKKALVSTGIGALIVAVGMLLANFDKIRDLFKKKNPLEDANKRYEELKTAINENNAKIEREIELMAAAGVSTQELIDKKIELLRIDKQLNVEEGKRIQNQIKEIEGHSKIRRWITGENKDLEELNKKYKELYETDQNYIKLIADAENSKEADKIRKRTDAVKEEKRLLDEVLKKVKENSQSEIQTLTEKYNKELALLKKYGKDTTELTRQYEEDVTKIREQSLDNLYSKLAEYSDEDAFAKIQRDAEKAEETLRKFASVVDNKFPPEGIKLAAKATDEMLEKARKLGLEGTESAESFSLAYKLAYREYLTAIGMRDDMHTKMGATYREAKKDFENSADGSLNKMAAQYKMLSTYADSLADSIEHIELVLKNTDTLMDNSYWEGTIFEGTEAADRVFILTERLKKYKELWLEISPALAEAARNLDNYNIAEENLSRETEILEKQFGKDSWQQWFMNTSQFYEIYDARLKAAEWYRDNLETIENETAEQRRRRELEAEQAILQIKREYAKKHIEISQNLGNGLTSIWGSINDIYESNAKAQGKTDEEIFNQTKGSKIAVATIDTIQGALAAFMGYQELPQPYGAILGAIQAAAVTAAGMAQIAQIKATQFNDAGQNISNPQAVVNATPRMADYTPDLVSNVTGASDTDYLKNALQETPIYVSVTDINNAQAKVTDRDKESSF